MIVELLKERPINREHHLFAFAFQEKRRPRDDDAVIVHCSCGERLTSSVRAQRQSALDLAACNHKRHIDA